jgi:hypothetical protein
MLDKFGKEERRKTYIYLFIQGQKFIGKQSETSHIDFKIKKNLTICFPEFSYIGWLGKC